MRLNKLFILFFFILFSTNSHAGFFVGVKNPSSHSSECVGWNCGILLDSNAQSWYFYSTSVVYDNVGSFTLTNTGVGADASTYISGSFSADFEYDESDRLTKTGTTNDWGWGDTGNLTITFWFRTESALATNTPFFVKGITGTTQCIDIEHYYGHLMRLRVDGNDDGTWENYAFTNTYSDNQWYFFAVTINSTTSAYYATLWGQTEAATIETISGTLTNGMANMDADGAVYVGNNSGAVYFDGNMDDLTIWNRCLSSDEIAEIRQGIFK